MSSMQSNTASVEAMRPETSLTHAAAGEGLWSNVWQQLRRDPIALAGLYVVCILVTMALFDDFLANDKPCYSFYTGKTIFPLVRIYLVAVGLVNWPSEVQNV